MIARASGRAHLIDFGTVQSAAATASGVSSTAAGTFGYAPMEQFIGRATPASDLYSLAMTFVAVITGRAPEQMRFEQNKLDLRDALSSLPKALDVQLQFALEELLEPDAAARPQSARDVLQRLAHLNRHGFAPSPSRPARAEGSGGAEPWRASMSALREHGPRAMLRGYPKLSFAFFDQVVLSTDGRWAAAFHIHHGLELINLGTMRSTHVELRPDDRASVSMVFAPNSCAMLINSSDSTWCVVVPIDASGPGTPRYLQKVGGPLLKAHALALDPKGELLACAHYGEGPWQVTLLDATSGAPVSIFGPDVHELGSGEWVVQRLEFSADGSVLACHTDGKVLLHDNRGRQRWQPWRALTFDISGGHAAFLSMPNFGGGDVHLVPLGGSAHALMEDIDMQPYRLHIDVQGEAQALALGQRGRYLGVLHKQEDAVNLTCFDRSARAVAWQTAGPVCEGPMTYVSSLVMLSDDRVALQGTLPLHPTRSTTRPPTPWSSARSDRAAGSGGCAC